MSESVLELTAENVDLTSSGAWLVDFWATWCGPCRELEPVLKELAGEISHTRIGKVEVGANQALAERFGVSSVPTLVLLRDGQVVRRLFGTKTKRQLTRVLDEAASGND